MSSPELGFSKVDEWNCSLTSGLTTDAILVQTSLIQFIVPLFLLALVHNNYLFIKCRVDGFHIIWTLDSGINDVKTSPILQKMIECDEIISFLFLYLVENIRSISYSRKLVFVVNKGRISHYAFTSKLITCLYY